MELNNLTAVSPIDGRYRKQVESLDQYFSEFALIKYRVLVEVEYFFFLADTNFFTLNADVRRHLRKAADDFGIDDAVVMDQSGILDNYMKMKDFFPLISQTFLYYTGQDV